MQHGVGRFAGDTLAPILIGNPVPELCMTVLEYETQRNRTGYGVATVTPNDRERHFLPTAPVCRVVPDPL